MRAFAVLGLGLAGAIVASCREPTSILVDISTDVDCATVSKQKVVLRIGTRIIWVGNGTSILEADATGGNVRTDLDASQGFGPIGDLVADDGAVYFLSKGLPHKVARK